MNLTFSVVIPIYQAEKIIGELLKQIKEAVITIDKEYEIILVNDASRDASWEIIKEECSRDMHIKGINLSRNFGQHYAIAAGLDKARGEWIIVMDCDLQDNPAEIPNLYKKALEGYDTVFAQRTTRKDPLSKRFFSRCFYYLFSYLTDTHQDPSVSNFGIYHRNVIDAVKSMKDHSRLFPVMVQWVGFNKFWLPVQHSGRFEGNSTYRFKGLFHLALNAFIAFSDKPLRITVKTGLLIASISFIIGLIYLIRYLSGKILVLGFTSLIISIWFLAGIIILILGILGLYLGKVFEEAKQRPFYIVRETFNI